MFQIQNGLKKLKLGRTMLAWALHKYYFLCQTVETLLLWELEATSDFHWEKLNWLLLRQQNPFLYSTVSKKAPHLSFSCYANRNADESSIIHVFKTKKKTNEKRKTNIMAERAEKNFAK